MTKMSVGTGTEKKITTWADLIAEQAVDRAKLSTLVEAVQRDALTMARDRVAMVMGVDVVDEPTTSLREVLGWFDDLVSYVKALEQRTTDLEKVLDATRDAGLYFALQDPTSQTACRINTYGYCEVHHMDSDNEDTCLHRQAVKILAGNRADG